MVIFIVCIVFILSLQKANLSQIKKHVKIKIKQEITRLSSNHDKLG